MLIFKDIMSFFDCCIVDKGLENVKRGEKLKRKRKQGNTSRKRRKCIVTDKEVKCKEAIEDEVARKHFSSIENVESENQEIVETEKIQPTEKKEKATLQSRNLPEVITPRRKEVMVLMYFCSFQCFLLLWIVGEAPGNFWNHTC